MGSLYFTIEMTKEELDEISIALKERIDLLSKRIYQVQTEYAKQLVAEMLLYCLTAQAQIRLARHLEESE